MSSEFIGMAEEKVDLTFVAITLAYPILDLILIDTTTATIVKILSTSTKETGKRLPSKSCLIQIFCISNNISSLD